MKTLYIECNMGAAGDMLTAALLELLPDPDAFVEKLNTLGIPGVEYKIDKTQRGGIVGTHVTVTVNGSDEADITGNHHHGDHEHHTDHDHHVEHDHHHDDHHHEDHHEHHSHEHHHEHRSLDDIRNILNTMDISDEVRLDVMQVYDLIAEAESEAHGKPVSEIHFHEVGAMDAIADITAVSMLLREIAPEQIIVSSVATGSGTVNCAHGTLPVPAPATASILAGVPTHTGDVEAELCTPTGAALLKCIADDFGPRPSMVTEKIGYGMGTRDFGDAANMLRIFLGDAEDVDTGADEESGSAEKPFSDESIWAEGTGNNSDPVHNRELSDDILELKCNLDDMTGEQIGFVVDQLLFNGAADVFLTPIFMKKNRPATLLTCLCRESLREEMIRLIFRYTSTIGIRETLSRRYILDRSEFIMRTDDGPIRTKHVRGYGVDRKKYEYDDLARLARDKHISIQEAKEYVDKRGTY